MPFIKKLDRVFYDNHITMEAIETKGELEYCIYRLMRIYMRNRTYNYTYLHDTVYAAMHCAHEFRRNYLDVREDAAKEENGDIM